MTKTQLTKAVKYAVRKSNGEQRALANLVINLKDFVHWYSPAKLYKKEDLIINLKRDGN